LIEKAQKKLKTAVGNDDSIYNAISVGIDKNIAVLEKAAEIYSECKTALEKKGIETTETTTLLNKLETYKAGSDTEKAAWTAINKYKPNDKEYGVAAIENLKNLAKNSQKKVTDYLNYKIITKESEVDEARVKAEKDPD